MGRGSWGKGNSRRQRRVRVRGQRRGSKGRGSNNSRGRRRRSRASSSGVMRQGSSTHSRWQVRCRLRQVARPPGLLHLLLVADLGLPWQRSREGAPQLVEPLAAQGLPGRRLWRALVGAVVVAAHQGRRLQLTLSLRGRQEQQKLQLQLSATSTGAEGPPPRTLEPAAGLPAQELPFATQATP